MSNCLSFVAFSFFFFWQEQFDVLATHEIRVAGRDRYGQSPKKRPLDDHIWPEDDGLKSWSKKYEEKKKEGNKEYEKTNAEEMKDKGKEEQQ